MVIKLYISGISGNKEVKKKQQRVQMILDSKNIKYEAIDITEPANEKDKEYMQQNGKVRESLGKHPLPPQIFNEENYCGDYEDFDLANEVDELEKFLQIESSTTIIKNETKLNGTREVKPTAESNEETVENNKPTPPKEVDNVIMDLKDVPNEILDDNNVESELNFKEKEIDEELITEVTDGQETDANVENKEE